MDSFEFSGNPTNRWTKNETVLPLTLLVDVSMVRISKSYVTPVSMQSRFQKTSDFDLRSRSVGFKLDRDFLQMHLWYESPTLGSCRVVAFTRLSEKMDLSVTFGLLHLWYNCVLLLRDKLYGTMQSTHIALCRWTVNCARMAQFQIIQICGGNFLCGNMRQFSVVLCVWL